MSQKSLAYEAKPTRRIIRMAQLRQKYPVSESQIFSLIKRGRFPRPFALAPEGVLWAGSRTRSMTTWTNSPLV